MAGLTSLPVKRRYMGGDFGQDYAEADAFGVDASAYDAMAQAANVAAIEQQASQQADVGSTLDDIYASIDPNAARGRAGSYADFMSARGDAGPAVLDEYFAGPQSFRDMLETELEKGPAPANVVTNTFGLPVETTHGYLTYNVANPNLAGYDPEKAAQLQKTKSPEYFSRELREQLLPPEQQLLMDPVIQDILSKGPKASLDTQRNYTKAVRQASQAMTPEQRYGVLDPTIPFEDPRMGTRIGGYLPTLEKDYNLPTYMGGFRGGRETSAPYALTDPESDRYQDIFMAFAGTKGGAIRAALDTAKPGETVEGLLGRDAFGLPAQASATGLANYMDREALKGWAQGVGIVTSMTSPFMPAVAMGLPQDVWEDVKGPLNSLREQLKDVIPNFEKVEEKFDKAVDVVRDNYEKNVKQTGTDILDTIFDAINGKGASQEAREFGNNYQLPSGVREAIEVGVEDIAPVQTDIGGLPSEAFFETPVTDIGGVPASEFLDIEPMMLFDPVVDQMPMSKEVPDTLDDAIAYSQALERTRDFYEAEAARKEAAALAGPEAYPFPSRPLELPPISPILSEAMFDQKREADIRSSAGLQNMLQEYPVELAAPISPVQVAPLGASAVAVPEADRAVEIQQLAPLPEEVDIEQATFREPSAIEKSTPVEFGREELIPIEPEDFDNLVNAVAMVESNNNQAAIGKDGERGALQVMPGTLEKPGFNIEPARNKSLDEVDRVGRDYLLTMAAKFGNVQDALVAYNAGPTFAESWIARGRKVEDLPETTQNYLVRVADELN